MTQLQDFPDDHSGNNEVYLCQIQRLQQRTCKSISCTGAKESHSLHALLCVLHIAILLLLRSLHSFWAHLQLRHTGFGIKSVLCRDEFALRSWPNMCDLNVIFLSCLDCKYTNLSKWKVCVLAILYELVRNQLKSDSDRCTLRKQLHDNNLCLLFILSHQNTRINAST